ncbi:MAG: hypothetical protein P9L96_06800 [Candidatus Gygaella obscura]|nr:hypothetical protein [Candidatus Gygaella obscura]
MSIFIEPAKTVLLQIGSFLPKLIAAIIVFIVGWLLAKVIGELLKRFLKLIKLEQFADNVGVNKFLTKGGIKYTFCELLSFLVYWLVVLVVLVVAVDILGLTVAGNIIEKVASYIPNVIAALFILILGIFASSFSGSTVTAALTNAGIEQARLLGKVAEIIIIVFTIFVAIEQLGIAGQVIVLAITITFASIGLAVGLAFGLGCKDIAADFLKNFLAKIKVKK